MTIGIAAPAGRRGRGVISESVKVFAKTDKSLGKIVIHSKAVHSKCSVHPVTNVQTDATTNTYLIFSSPQNHNDGEARCRNTTTRGTDSCMSTLSTHMVGTQPESRPADQTSTTASDDDAAREASRHPCWALGHWRGGQSYASPFSRVIVHVTLSRR